MNLSPVPIAPRLVPAVARIGVIGTGGRICDVLKNLLRIAPDVRVTAVFDPDPSSVARCRAGVGPDAAVCASEAELCGRADVDWVFIGSWNSLHATQAVAAFAAGKHVFCEKPLALTLDEAARMHAAWRASGRTFALGLVLRYSPLYRAARARNLLVSPGCYFRPVEDDSRADDRWMRVNVSRCEGTTLTQALKLLGEIARG